MKYVIAVTNRHTDTELFGPYDSEADAQSAIQASWESLWDLADEDGSVEVFPLQDPGSWR